MSALQRLEEIDRELDAFGMSTAALAEVCARARAASPSGLAAIDAALDALEANAASRAAPEDGPRQRPAQVETIAPPHAREARWDERPTTGGTGSGVIEVPDDVLREEPLPPVLALEQHGAAQHTEESGAVAAAHPLPSGSDADASGLVLDDLANDAHDAPTATAPSTLAAPGRDEAGLEHLFDDATLSDADEAAGAALADPFASAAPAPAASAPEGLAELLAGGLESYLAASDGTEEREDELEESTALFSAEEVRAMHDAAAGGASPTPQERTIEPAADPSGEFELMVDEVALELESDEAAPAADEPAAHAASPTASSAPAPAGSRPPPAGSQPPPPKGGLLSRILNRK